MKKLLAVLLLLSACCSSNLTRKSETKLVQGLVNATVLVETETGSGSGTVLYSDGKRTLILTCYHVIAGDQFVVVKSRLLDTTPALVEKVSYDHDLALLVVLTTTKLPVIRVASQEPDLYERLYVVGSPLGEFGHASDGFLTSKKAHNQELPSETLWRITNAFTFPGVSGGTATNSAGELVCVPSNGEGYGGNMIPQVGYCVGLPDIKEILKDYKL